MQDQKKMTVTQLTLIVAVNMMGSGIIMLPANMAQIGAISLLSWLITALGSMAIAYGFAQAGVFDRKAGGMPAYAEEAHGRSGSFVLSYLYYISLAIANVAIATSALGYLAPFFPWLNSTPVMTMFGVVGLIWITTLANFGGPKITGRIGAITVWGVIIPVAGLSVIGWFWFSGETFSQAWNPKGLSIMEGLGSSITLTLWAFLGMESAAQSAGAVENPRKNVPLACMLGTAGAAVVYILSTTVIMGIVPNADLANSTGPFGLVYAQMFSPMIGNIIMALAALACVGSLLGWQFTISQTGKLAADDGMFPKFLGKVNSMGAPVIGMILIGIVQTVFAFSTVSPSLSEQFNVLVDLSVVTNVIPYIIALTGLMVMMKKEDVSPNIYLRNSVVVIIAVSYSIFALYASGAKSVVGGVLIMMTGYLIYGFMSPRFELAKLNTKTMKE
ncbi:putrescine-ornithine antiporter [Marinicella sp. W31]|uniref:putrescine-ornithine antiporter n=1 Tax=Marinicella sp. W31 TaxID=3023713 RepID=UPI0037562DCB